MKYSSKRYILLESMDSSWSNDSQRDRKLLCYSNVWPAWINSDINSTCKIIETNGAHAIVSIPNHLLGFFITQLNVTNINAIVTAGTLKSISRKMMQRIKKLV